MRRPESEVWVVHGTPPYEGLPPRHGHAGHAAVTATLAAAFAAHRAAVHIQHRFRARRQAARSLGGVQEAKRAAAAARIQSRHRARRGARALRALHAAHTERLHEQQHMRLHDDDDTSARARVAKAASETAVVLRTASVSTIQRHARGRQFRATLRAVRTTSVSNLARLAEQQQRAEAAAQSRIGALQHTLSENSKRHAAAATIAAQETAAACTGLRRTASAARIQRHAREMQHRAVLRAVHATSASEVERLQRAELAAQSRVGAVLQKLDGAERSAAAQVVQSVWMRRRRRKSERSLRRSQSGAGLTAHACRTLSPKAQQQRFPGVLLDSTRARCLKCVALLHRSERLREVREETARMPDRQRCPFDVYPRYHAMAWCLSPVPSL